MGIYTTNNVDACKYITEHSEAEVVVCENKKQLEKFLQISHDLPNLKVGALLHQHHPGLVTRHVRHTQTQRERCRPAGMASASCRAGVTWRRAGWLAG